MKQGDAIVLDASVALTWCYPDENSGYAYRVLDVLEDGRAMVPGLWAVEIANALAVGERRHRLNDAAAAQFLELIGALSIETDRETASRALTTTRHLALAYNLSVYDATYLELAMREGLTLATLDLQLKKAAKAAGIKVYV